MAKFYAVAKGHRAGIYTTWAAAKQQVDGVAGARYKSFPTRNDAQAWLDAGGNYAKQSHAKKVTPATTQVQHDEKIVLYSDGGSRNTGNTAGGHVKQGDKAAWAYLIKSDGQQFFDSLGEFGATNNKMEITGLLQALTALKNVGLNQEPILAVLDSKYVLDAITKNWLQGWQRRGWQRSAGELANKELWAAIYDVLKAFPHLRFEWTKGHADNSGNVFVDELLNQTMDAMDATNPTGKRTAVEPLGTQQTITPPSVGTDQLDLF
ncbi:ribonuclease H family protein [Furfurilactobacillus siliginis]|uniref:ribonuclease H n=1 Tax=Furfurilactobacillus siliginis TaxID=348151 RepID=A0A0R2LEY0_9LACO|nr:ribonuclease H family protein [Furfurilactobacillus siliginis]KRN97159.1 RNase HI [Furfurilactobacillus siliginis]GEK29522.1 ribonuclease H [Furfurilactobacillus siliginis]